MSGTPIQSPLQVINPRVRMTISGTDIEVPIQGFASPNFDEPIETYHFQSGNPFPIQLVSGLIQSGYGLITFLSGYVQSGQVGALVGGSASSKGDSRADWIRESTQEQWPWTSGIASNVLADLLLDHGRPSDAEIIRRSE